MASSPSTRFLTQNCRVGGSRDQGVSGLQKYPGGLRGHRKVEGVAATKKVGKECPQHLEKGHNSAYFWGSG